MLNLRQAAIIEPILTGIVRGFSQNELIGSVLYPKVPVLSSGGQIITFGKEAMKAYDTRRAPGAMAQRMELGYGSQKFALTNHALDAILPREIARDALAVPHVALAEHYVTTVYSAMQLELEREQAALACNPANYGPNNTMNLTGSQKWSDPGSDPKSDVQAGKAAIRKATGKAVTVMVIGAIVYEALQVNQKIQDHFKYTTSGSITLEMLQNYFSIPLIVVGTAVSSSDGNVFSDVWPGSAILAFTQFGAQSNAQPTFGFTYTLEGMPMVEMPYYSNDRRSWVYGVSYERAPVVSWSDAGFLINGAV